MDKTNKSWEKSEKNVNFDFKLYLNSRYFWAFVMQKHAFVFQYWDDIVSNKNEFQHNKFQGLLNSLEIRIWVEIWQLASPSFSLQIFPATAKTTTFHWVPNSTNVMTSAGTLFLAAFSHTATSTAAEVQFTRCFTALPLYFDSIYLQCFFHYIIVFLIEEKEKKAVFHSKTPLTSLTSTYI